jgi:hypothetical protein
MLFIKVSKFTELQITRKPNITPITIYREYHRVTLITDIGYITTFQISLFLLISWRVSGFLTPAITSVQGGCAFEKGN